MKCWLLSEGFYTVWPAGPGPASGYARSNTTKPTMVAYQPSSVLLLVSTSQHRTQLRRLCLIPIKHVYSRVSYQQEICQRYNRRGRESPSGYRPLERFSPKALLNMDVVCNSCRFSHYHLGKTVKDTEILNSYCIIYGESIQWTVINP